ncbi:TasA family protein [Rossellomorea marisflavi]|uniref:TasA family protein n=1 Tax=Rossellomorea marisflavi TaxID=189381 RepID=UPI0025B0781F|nr:TasA family protein [Rossellomorea marisflavi]WJV19364.1 TasA family protein [Rossellomorea marisflavi]
MKMKKALIGTMMAGALVIGAGASTGTYSDFFSEANSAGNKIQLGTLKLSQTGNVDALFDADNLKPGSVVNGTVFKVGNTGSLPGKLSVDVENFVFTDSKGQAVKESDYGKYKDVIVKLDVNNGAYVGEASLGELPGLFSKVNQYLANKTFQSMEEYTIKPTLTVKKTSENQNDLQGVYVGGDLHWKLTQLQN